LVPPPPRSTVFPYTTLCRAEALRHVRVVVVGGPTHAFGMSRPSTRAEAVQRASGAVSDRETGLREWVESVPRQSEPRLAATFDRSEEHTSELQSRENLVCRL